MAKRVLVVEDNALNLKLFCDLLGAHGHETAGVKDSREAVATARSFAPDLIISDIQLPYVSGIELIEQFRRDPAFADVPIMAVTAYATPDDEERARHAGATGYVSKPISVMKFISAVEGLLGGQADGKGEPN